MQTTSLTSGVLMLWKTLEEYGYDSDGVFRSVDLEPEKLFDPDARYPDEKICRLWEAIIKQIDEPCLGLTVAQHFHPTTLHALGFAWLSSDTLESAFNRVIRYSKIITDLDVLQFSETDHDFQFSIEPHTGDFAFPDEDHDMSLAIVVDLCRLSLGKDFHPIKIQMRRAVPACLERFQAYFQTEIIFNAPSNTVHFDKAAMKNPLATANAELARLNEGVIVDYLARMEKHDVVMRVRKKIIDQLPSGGVTQTGIAGALNMSERSLQRRLKEKETSFKQLMDETRKELARGYMDDAKLSVSEITYMLGFSEPANFSRAFRRWNGSSPSAYRMAKQT